METHSVTVMHSSKRAMLSPCSWFQTSAAETAKARFFAVGQLEANNLVESKGTFDGERMSIGVLFGEEGVNWTSV